MTSTEITVGGLVTVADFGTQLGKAAEARVAEANKDGEIPCGRKINLVETADDQSSTTTNLSIIQRLVEQDHVFAIVPTDTPFIEAGEHLRQPESRANARLGHLTVVLCVAQPAVEHVHIRVQRMSQSRPSVYLSDHDRGTNPGQVLRVLGGGPRQDRGAHR